MSKSLSLQKKVNALVAIFLLPFFALLLSGCEFYPKVESENYDADLKLSPKGSIFSSRQTVEEFQYAAPWDKELYEKFYTEIQEVPDIGEVRGGVIPHHLTAGYIPATFFHYLSKQKPSVVVVLGPNHLGSGGANAISTLRNWQTPFGMAKTETKIIGKLAAQGIVKIDEDVIKEEYSLCSIIPFIKKSLPDAQVLPIMLGYKTSEEKLDKIIAELIKFLPSDAVVVGSVDFSHYQTLAVADFHDEISRSVINNFDFERINNLDVDSASSLYVVLKLMENFSTRRIGFEISDNSANILQDNSMLETTSYYSPYFINGDPSKENTAGILHFGDMMLDRDVQKKIAKNSQDYIFEKLAGQENRFFWGTDEVGANLEGPFADARRPSTKSISFRFDPALIPTLKKYNFSSFSLANNHSFDMGKDGFVESKKNLEKAGLNFYGSQYSIDDESLLVKEVGDFSIGFVGVNDTNSPINFSKTKQLIEKAEQEADFTVINIHWGEEYKEISNARQRKLARDLIDAGADVIIGHHPHVVQEMEIYKNRPIFYSLGNFVFDQYFSTATQQGLALGLVLYDDKISVNIFPLQSKAAQTSQMEHGAALDYLNAWQKKGRIGENQFNNFNLVVPL